MTEHTKTPWKVFTTPDGRKLVGVGGEDGEGILDCGFGVWAWDDAAGIANANLVVKAVNSHDFLVKALTELLDACESIGDFKNGVVHNCIDEGEVYAGQLIDQARDALSLVGSETGRGK